MNIGELIKEIASYLQVESTTIVKGRTVHDLTLSALNRSRKWAELHHDWNCQQVVTYVTTVGGKGSWSSMKDVITDDDVTIKTPNTFYFNKGNFLVPLHHYKRKTGANWLRQRTRHSSDGGRYPAQSGHLATMSYELGKRSSAIPDIFMYGSTFELSPLTTENVRIVVDGFKWLDPYTDDADTDFFTECGEEFLMWRTIVDLNHIFQVFVPRQEGSIAPPQKAADRAYLTLREHDIYLTEDA